MGVIAQLVPTTRESDSALLNKIGSGGNAQDSAHVLAGQKQGESVATYLFQSVAESIYVPGSQTQKGVIKHKQTGSSHDPPC